MAATRRRKRHDEPLELPATTVIPQAALAEAIEHRMGWCPVCRDFTRDVDDLQAGGYACPACRNVRVIGAELALLAGLISVEEPADEKKIAKAE